MKSNANSEIVSIFIREWNKITIIVKEMRLDEKETTNN